MKKAIIIGSGIGGIALSIRLSRMGFSVKVFESNSYAGGKLHEIKKQGFRFDAGPSLFTMPHFVDELYQICNENADDHFNYFKKEIACKYFWEDGTKLTAYGEKEKLLDEIEKKLNVSKSTLINYFDRSRNKYDLTAPIFLNKSLNKLDTYLTKETVKAISSIFKFDIYKTLHEVNKEQLKEPHLVQLFDRFATYVGSNPFQTSGIMTLIQHLEFHMGTFLPSKGMFSISKSLLDLSKRQGVEFIFNSYVDKIILKNNKAIGVNSLGKFYKSDIVISNMDINPTYKYLMKNQLRPKKILESEPSSSGVIFYWGISKKFHELDLHNVFFSNNYQQEFEEIFLNHNVSKDPSIYINITSKDIEGDAPENSENWFVMVNTPYDIGQNWKSMVNKIRINVQKKISRILNIDISEYIVFEDILTPKTIQFKTKSHLGSLYGPSSNSRISAFFRHPNFSKKTKNLFFCGGSVHPGGGIPLCLLSAKITADLVKNYCND